MLLETINLVIHSFSLLVTQSKPLIHYLLAVNHNWQEHDHLYQFNVLNWIITIFLFQFGNMHYLCLESVFGLNQSTCLTSAATFQFVILNLNSLIINSTLIHLEFVSCVTILRFKL